MLSAMDNGDTNDHGPSALQGYLAYNKLLPPEDFDRALGIVLL